MTQVGLNYSRPAAQDSRTVLSSSYVLGSREGYKNVQHNSLMVAKYLHEQIGSVAEFRLMPRRLPSPDICILYEARGSESRPNRPLWPSGQTGPEGLDGTTHAMPANIEQMVVMRVLCKQGFSRDMADQLLADIRFAIDELNKLKYPTPTRIAMGEKHSSRGLDIQPHR